MNKRTLVGMILAAIFVTTTVVAIFGFNYWGADLSKLPKEAMVVERIYHKTEYNTKRVSKNVYTRTNPHEVYYLSLRRSNGSSKNVKVKYEIYKRASVGDTALLPIGPGRLGWEITDESHLTIPHPRKPAGRNHCRFVGTSGKKVSPDSILNSMKRKH